MVKWWRADATKEKCASYSRLRSTLYEHMVDFWTSTTRYRFAFDKIFSNRSSVCVCSDKLPTTITVSIRRSFELVRRLPSLVSSDKLLFSFPNTNMRSFQHLSTWIGMGNESKTILQLRTEPAIDAHRTQTITKPLPPLVRSLHTLECEIRQSVLDLSIIRAFVWSNGRAHSAPYINLFFISFRGCFFSPFFFIFIFVCRCSGSGCGDAIYSQALKMCNQFFAELSTQQLTAESAKFQNDVNHRARIVQKMASTNQSCAARREISSEGSGDNGICEQSQR